jgi:hypothetical protein
MSTVLVTNSQATFKIKETSVVSVPIDGQFNIGIPPEQVTVVAATFPIAPGPQATVLPSWVPTSSDYETLLGDGLVSQITQANAVTLLAGQTSANVELFTSGTPTTAVVNESWRHPRVGNDAFCRETASPVPIRCNCLKDCHELPI